MTIKDMKTGQKAQVLKVTKGSRAERRLFELGVIPGAKVELLSSHPFQGPLVLQIGNSRIALGRGIAASVEIQIENQ